MIKIYGMKTCHDCKFVAGQIKNDKRFVMIDIGEQVQDLKTFIHLRDHNPVFDAAKATGSVGIPCFVLEDGTVTLNPEDVGLKGFSSEGASCSLDGKGC